MSRRLEGRVALVTGASRGIGAQIARWFADDGAQLVLCARTPGPLGQLADELRDSGSQVVTEPCDVSDPEALASLVSRGIEAFGSIDIAVANAAMFGPVGPIETTDPRQWARTLEVNVAGCATTIRAVVPTMAANGWGRIIALAGGGVGGPRPLTRATAYVASKAAVMALIEVTASDLPHGVTANAVAPGPVPTGFMDEVLAAGPDIAGETLLAAALDAEPRDLTPLRDLCRYLTSDESSWLNGRSLSARWETVEVLQQLTRSELTESRFRLRRIDEALYSARPSV